MGNEGHYYYNCSIHLYLNNYILNGQLLEKVNGIASDVKQLQEKQEKQHPNVICKSCQKLVSTASNSNDSTSTSSPSSLQTKSDPLLSNPVVTEPISLETLLSNLRNAVTQMGAASAKVSSSIPTLETIEDPSKPQPQLSTATAIAPTPLQKGCDMLLMYLKNIKMQPGVPRYRKISTTNASYRDSLESLAGHHAVLEAVGFAKAGSYFEWTWTAAAIDSTANSNLNLLQSKKHNSLPVPDEAMVETILGEGIRLLEELRNS